MDDRSTVPEKFSVMVLARAGAAMPNITATTASSFFIQSLPDAVDATSVSKRRASLSRRICRQFVMRHRTKPFVGSLYSWRWTPTAPFLPSLADGSLTLRATATKVPMLAATATASQDACAVGLATARSTVI
jgi:hypothetical protein